MKTRADRIRWVRKVLGLSQEKFANRLGTTRGAVGNWELGQGIKTENLTAISERFHVPMDWLANGRGDPPTISADLRSEDVAAGYERRVGQALKVSGYVGANGQTGFYALADDRYESIPGSADDPEGAVALEIMGTSAGRWLDRWYVVINQVQDTITPDMLGRPCVVWLPDGRILLKEIVKNGALYDLISNDSGEPPIRGVKIKSAAKVLRFIHR